MTDEMMACECGYKGVKSGLMKTKGFCPKCGNQIYPEMEVIGIKKKDLNLIISEHKKARGVN